MRSVRAIILALFLIPGVAFAQRPENQAESLPAPPAIDIESAPAWVPRYSQEFWDNACFLPQFSQTLLQSIPVPPDPWDAVQQLKVGRKIKVVNSDLTRLKGRFVSATADAITFRLSEGTREEMTLPRRDVRMVSIRHSKALQVLTMALFGALFVALEAATTQAKAPDDCWSCEQTNHVSGTGVAVAAGVGALVFGLAEGLAEPSDEVIFVQTGGAMVGSGIQESPATSEGSDSSAPGAVEPHRADVPPVAVSLPGAAGQPEGGNVFVPSDAEATKEATETQEKELN